MTEPAFCVFLSGADMDPTVVLATFPRARFLARARVSAESNEIATSFARRLASGEGQAEVWGILIEQVNGVRETAETRQAITDDGRPFQVILAGEQLASGEPDAVVAAARYWELPPVYVGKLRDAVAAAEDEPSDDGK